MAKVNKIDSNVTGLRYAEEASLGVLPGTPDWIPMEPNSYSDFGGEVSKIARNPINPSRQRKKGVSVDLDASGGIVSDITQTNVQSLLQGFMFADLRPKGTEIATGIAIVGASPDQYDVASTTGFLAGSLVKGSGFVEAANNGVNEILTVNVDASVEVLEGSLVAEVPAADASIRVVGHVGAASDIDVDVSGALPALSSTLLDFTTLGLIPGEWVYIGGDSAGSSFVNAVNNGFARVRSVAAGLLTFDKTSGTMVTETGTGLSIELYFGTVLKNELGTLIKRRTYQLERTLGAPDDSLPAEVQSEYLVGSVPSELTFNIPSAEKVTLDMSFVSQTIEQYTGAEGVKTGNRPSLIEADAFNTSSDFSRIKLAKVVPGDAAPVDLFAFAEEMTITLGNNLEPNKALGYFGSFEITAGTFEVGGSMTAYFADITATKAIIDNDDLTFDVHMIKQNSGITFDMPLLSLGDGRPNVEQDQAIKLPLTMEAATGAKIDSTLDYTFLFMFWDYLPTAAEA